MATTYVQIGSTVTVGVLGATDITFSSIPATYTDLKVVISSRSTITGGPAEANRISFNGDTTNGNYTQKRLLGSGTAASSQSQTGRETFFSTGVPATANTFANSEIYIPNYASANAKSASIDTVSENNATEAYAALIAILWSGTAAITSIAFTPETPATSFVQYTTATLYGIKNS
jgi:hypothetical protein